MDRLPNRYRTQVTAVSWYGLEAGYLSPPGSDKRKLRVSENGQDT